MGSEPSASLPDILIGFIAKLLEYERVWLAAQCAFGIEEPFKGIKTAAEVGQWFGLYLHGASGPGQRFGRLIHLIAALDIELSPFALGRFVAQAEHIAQADDECSVDEVRHLLQEKVARRKAMVDAWQDLRTRELDQASLWVYRDSIQAEERAELGRMLASRGRPPEAPQ